MLICYLLWVVFEIRFPGFVYLTGFNGGFGLSISGLVKRIITQALCCISSLAVLILISDKDGKLTKYGQRTMPPYLLHMLIVFPVSWTLLYPFREMWWGQILLFILPTALCIPLFSKPVEKFVNRVLKIEC